MSPLVFCGFQMITKFPVKFDGVLIHVVSAIVVYDFRNFLGFCINVLGKDIAFVIGKRVAVGEIPVMDGCVDQTYGTVILCVVSVHNAVFIAQIKKFIVLFLLILSK